MNLYVVLDPANSLWWVWIGREDQAASGTRHRVSPQGWDHQEDAVAWGQGFAEGAAWATAQVKTQLEQTIVVLGETLAVTT